MNDMHDTVIRSMAETIDRLRGDLAMAEREVQRLRELGGHVAEFPAWCECVVVYEGEPFETIECYQQGKPSVHRVFKRGAGYRTERFSTHEEAQAYADELNAREGH